VRLLGALLGGSFVVASLVVGLRLVWLARRTRRSPELLVGSGLLLLAVLGYPLMTVARKALALAEPTRIGLAAASGAAQAAGGLLLVIFVWRVFRPEARWARWIAFVFAACAGGLVALQTGSPGWWVWVAEERGVWAAARWLFLVPIGWGALESLHYWQLLRRRLPLGLTDPVLVDRFRLFGIAMGFGLLSNLGAIALQLAGIELVGTAIGTVAVSPALVAAVALWLVFLPPRRYLERVRRNQPEAG
jgi:hypothetical protein